MTSWCFEPRDPLVVRDGRPNQGRSESSVLRFPYPGTMAGMVRTRLGSDEQGCFQIPKQQLHALRAVTLHGPLLSEPERGMLMMPAPGDCLFIAEPESNNTRHAVLHPLKDALLWDESHPLRPVGLDKEEVVPGKPPKDMPIWWPWPHVEQWLTDPHHLDIPLLKRDGLVSLPTEPRIHVKLGPGATAEEGMLFATEGLRFTHHNPDQPERTLAIWVDVGPCNIQGEDRTLRPGMAPGGGERRLGRWFETPNISPPPMPDLVVKALNSDSASVTLRVILLTPAVFDAGWQPTWLVQPRCEVFVTLKAACVPRPETLSGWDFEKQQPKKTRRLVSAGSVYWIELQGQPEARMQWAQEVWMHNISDQEQDRRDGFGLAALGVTP